MFWSLLVLSQLALLFKCRMADLARVRSKASVDSEVVFDITIFVKTIIAVSAKIHRVVPFRRNIVYFFGEVYSFFAPHVSDRIGFRVDGIDSLRCALAATIILVFRKWIRVQDIWYHVFPLIINSWVTYVWLELRILKMLLFKTCLNRILHVWCSVVVWHWLVVTVLCWIRIWIRECCLHILIRTLRKCHILVWCLNNFIVSLSRIGILRIHADVALGHWLGVRRRLVQGDLRKGKHLREHLININLINILINCWGSC